MVAIADSLKTFFIVFLQLFVAMDPLSVLPFLVPFLGGLPQARRGRVIRVVLITATGVGLLFLALGQAIFSVLGLTVPDFVIGGGLVLLVISLKDMVSSEVEVPPAPSELLAVVPIGTPLVMGPAAISLIILLATLHGFGIVLLAFLANVLAAAIIFKQSSRITRFLGEGGLKAFAKVAYLLQAAIGIQLIRRGLTELLPKVFS